MANKKSAEKRIRQTERKNARNSIIRAACRTADKKVRSAVASGNKEAALEALKMAESRFAKAATKGVYHKNKVARQVSRLSKLANSL